MTAARQDVQAVAKFVRVSPRKARLVADHIRGRSVPEARAILAFTPRAAAREVEKVLRSAVFNAETNPNRNWNGDELYVKAVYVDEGPTLKRWRPRARGRVSRILKRTCHITVKLDQYAAVEQPKRVPKAKAKPKAEPAGEKSKRTRKKKEAVA
jgi:large subunit ribosomal protein L22